MNKNLTNGILSFSFTLFQGLPLDARAVARQGGVSKYPWETLNMGGTVGDNPLHVAENKARAMRALDISPDNVFDVWQVHSTEVFYTRNPRKPEDPYTKADIILTDKPGLTLFMRFADCVPLFIYDPVWQAIGIGHAGWQGTINNVAGIMVTAMMNQFGSHPEDLLAAIGPAICLQHYPVGRDIYERFRLITETFSENGLFADEDHYHLDLKKINENQFRQIGVNKIENSGMCTACEPDLWFSHRRDNGQTGRFGAFITLTGRS